MDVLDDIVGAVSVIEAVAVKHHTEPEGGDPCDVGLGLHDLGVDRVAARVPA